jgi:mono/diheme cytochrome c family protein
MKFATTILALLPLADCVLLSVGHSYGFAPSAADTFKSKCAMCHSQDGSGSTPMGQKMKIHDLRSPEVQKQSDDDLTAIIRKGKQPMPAYGSSLSAGDIKELVAYIRSLAAK